MVGGDRSRVNGGNVPMRGLGKNFLLLKRENFFSGKLAKHGNFHALVAFMIILLSSLLLLLLRWWSSNEALATFFSGEGENSKEKIVPSQ